MTNIDEQTFETYPITPQQRCKLTIIIMNWLINPWEM